MTTRAALRTDLQRRLGDSAAAIWTAAELDGYITEGYDDLTKQTGCLFDVSLLPDYAFAFACTSAFEFDYLEAGFAAHGPAQYTCSFERDYVDNARGPANHTQPWEFNGGYQTTAEVAALVDLPESLQEIERATWNSRRLAALRSSDVEDGDGRYELNKGQVDGYLQDKDGLGLLRKWRVPSTAYTPYGFDDDTDLTLFNFTGADWEDDYLPSGVTAAGPAQFTCADDLSFADASDTGPGTHTAGWEYAYTGETLLNEDGLGILRDVTDILTVAVSGDWGDLVGVDGVDTFGDWGILGPLYRETNSVRVEYRRRGEVLSDFVDFEIPDRYTVVVRHYAEARALEREGKGQDMEMAAHFQTRYDTGIKRMNRRRKALRFQQTFVMGGTSGRLRGPVLARLPYNYGHVVR